MNSDKSNIKSDEIMDAFKDAIKNLKKVPQLYDEVNFNIPNIIEKIKKTSAVPIKKIIETYKNDYGITLIKTTVHLKLRNKLKYSYRKTILKPKDLNNLNYIKILLFS